MRDIEGIEKVVDKLKPHWNEIEEHFHQENEKFKALLAQDHDLIGRVLKCHLILEHYLDQFITNHYEIDNISDVKLSFHQKAALLPNTRSAASFVKPGIVKLNSIRNKFGHTLSPELKIHELGGILSVLDVARQGVAFNDPIEAIEAFTTVAVTFLIIPPPNLQSIFIDAFSEIRVNAL